MNLPCAFFTHRFNAVHYIIIVQANSYVCERLCLKEHMLLILILQCLFWYRPSPTYFVINTGGEGRGGG